MSVCVAQTQPNQYPFMSALEVRSLGFNMYRHFDSNNALYLKARVAYGTTADVRYITYASLCIQIFFTSRKRNYSYRGQMDCMLNIQILLKFVYVVDDRFFHHVQMNRVGKFCSSFGHTSLLTRISFQGGL